MQYALDADVSWVNAKLTEYRKHRSFFCGCAERHPVKLVKPSGVLGKRPFSDYFAHITSSEQGATDGRAVRSCGCSESQDHFNVKQSYNLTLTIVWNVTKAIDIQVTSTDTILQVK